MAIELPPLPYAMDALQPHLSKETLEFHYGKHHKTYVDKLNGFLPGTKYEKMSLEEMILASTGEAKIFNNAAQTWNHTFYWNGLMPNGGGEPKGAMADALKKAFGSFADFQKKFTDTNTLPDVHCTRTFYNISTLLYQSRLRLRWGFVPFGLSLLTVREKKREASP